MITLFTLYIISDKKFDRFYLCRVLITICAVILDWFLLPCELLILLFMWLRGDFNE